MLESGQSYSDAMGAQAYAGMLEEPKYQSGCFAVTSGSASF